MKITKEQKERAEKLASEHWGYVEKLLAVHKIPENTIELVGHHYISAMVHGYKHAIEDEQRKEIDDICNPIKYVGGESNKKMLFNSSKIVLKSKEELARPQQTCYPTVIKCRSCKTTIRIPCDGICTVCGEKL